MPFSTLQRVLIVEHYFRTQSYEAVKQSYQVHFPDAAVPSKTTIFQHVNRFHGTGSTVIIDAPVCNGVGDSFNIFSNYVIYMYRKKHDIQFWVA
jgi:hypothetical protein